MAGGTVSIDTQQLYLPSCKIIVNGSPLSREAEVELVRVSVDEDVSLPSMFTLEFAGLDDEFPRVDIQLIDDPQLFAIGNPVEVKLGYYEDKLDSLIKGEITALEPEFHFNLPPSLTVRGYDRRHRLQRGRKTRSFLQQKDSDIAAKIASEAGLTPQTQDSKVTHDYVLQANQTDIEFLQARASQIQYEVVVEDKTLFFRPVGNAKPEILTLTFQADLLEFYPRVSAIGQVSQTAVQGWNFKEKAKIVGQARVGDEVSTMGGQKSGAVLSQSAFGNTTGVISDHPIMTQAEADQLAKANFNQGVQMLITGEGICEGRNDLRAGKVIKIDGDRIGKQFRGEYYITAVSHRFSPRSSRNGRGGYYTHFTFRRNAF
jgi:phage protein D